MSENAYEDVQLVARSVEKMKLDKTPPDPPPRNIILKPVKSNIYRWSGWFSWWPVSSFIFCSLGHDRNESIKSSNILEEMMKENVGSERTDEVDMKLRDLGARPKTCNNSMTMDIR